MNNDEIACWLEGYVSVFQSCARGERQAAALHDYWGVPLIARPTVRFLINEAPDERRRISALLPHAAVG